MLQVTENYPAYILMAQENIPGQSFLRRIIVLTFKNFETGDRIVYNHSFAGLFLLGEVYLFIKGDYRNMYRYFFVGIPLGALLTIALWIQTFLSFIGLLVGVVLAILALVLWIKCLKSYPVRRIKDLFVDGYVPINVEQWKALEASKILPEAQYKSFSKLYGIE